MVKMVVEILVTRVPTTGPASRRRAVLSGEINGSGVGEAWLADKLASKALRLLDADYTSVSKHLDPAETVEATQDGSSARTQE